jgi:outer membrane protein OmpA-like peptidoglycan-associated protein
MGTGMNWMKRVGVVLAGLGIAASLTACSGTSKKDYEACMNENAQLRERTAELEQQVRDKDVQLAQARSAPIQQPAANPYPVAPVSGNAGGDLSGDSMFSRGDDGNLTATLAGEVLFDSGQATIKSSARSSLDRIASSLKGKYSGYNVRIGGHTDSDPIKKSASKWSSNDQLSQARADAVRSYLVSKGVSAGRISAVGYGSSQPKASNSTKSGKAQNRRVEITVLTR